eukprot:11192479-Lingulodinium_polyedra.AAC.1
MYGICDAAAAWEERTAPALTASGEERLRHSSHDGVHNPQPDFHASVAAGARELAFPPAGD